MNQSFLETIFKSQKFVKEYESFIDSLPRILSDDNESKIVKASESIFECYEFKRLDVQRFF